MSTANTRTAIACCTSASFSLINWPRSCAASSELFHSDVLRAAPEFHATGASFDDADASFDDSAASFYDSGASFDDAGASFDDSAASFYDSGASFDDAGASFDAAAPSFHDADASFDDAGASFDDAAASFHDADASSSVEKSRQLRPVFLLSSQSRNQRSGLLARVRSAAMKQICNQIDYYCM